MDTQQVGEWLAWASQTIEHAREQRAVNEVDGPPASIEAQALLAHLLGKPRAWLLAHPEYELTPEIAKQAHLQIERLAQGVPLPYLTGKQEFYGLEIVVTPDVLIPRPETELLVEYALKWLTSHPDRRAATDVGTGSGCIAVAVAHHAPQARFTAADRSWAALNVARRNVLNHGLTGRVHLLQSHLLSACAGPFDLICANLPYIPAQTLAGLAVTEHEPRLALDGGPDGLSLIRLLLEDGPRVLAPGGLMLLEIEASQGEAAERHAQNHFPFAKVSVLPDLAGHDRLVVVES